jgi:protein-L-isoaspartate O-methyltransferase
MLNDHLDSRAFRFGRSAAMMLVPREEFVPKHLRSLPTMTTRPHRGRTDHFQPYIVGYMTEALELSAGDRVLKRDR